jgi:hypothetical protein
MQRQWCIVVRAAAAAMCLCKNRLSLQQSLQYNLHQACCPGCIFLVSHMTSQSISHDSLVTVSVITAQAVQAALSRLAAMPALARSTALLLLTANGRSICSCCCCTLSSQPAALVLVCCMRCSCGSGGGNLRGMPLLPLALSTNAAVVLLLLLPLRVLTPACVCSCSAW